MQKWDSESSWCKAEGTVMNSSKPATQSYKVKIPSRIPNQPHSPTRSKHHPGPQARYTVQHGQNTIQDPKPATQSNIVKTPSWIPNQLHSLTWSKHHPGSQTSYTVWHELETRMTASVLKLLCFVLTNSILWNLLQSNTDTIQDTETKPTPSSMCKFPATARNQQNPKVHIHPAGPYISVGQRPSWHTAWCPAPDALQQSDKWSSPGNARTEPICTRFSYTGKPREILALWVCTKDTLKFLVSTFKTNSEIQVTCWTFSVFVGQNNSSKS